MIRHIKQTCKGHTLLHCSEVCNRSWHLSENPKLMWQPTRLIKRGGVWIYLWIPCIQKISCKTGEGGERVHLLAYMLFSCSSTVDVGSY